MTQTAEHDTGRIRVVFVPSNPDIPHWVSLAWIAKDMILPCKPIMGYPADDELNLKGELVVKTYGVDVPQDEALSILDIFHRHAAKWWRDNGFPQAGKYFHFKEQDIKIISGVTRQKVSHWNEMDSSPHR